MIDNIMRNKFLQLFPFMMLCTLILGGCTSMFALTVWGLSHIAQDGTINVMSHNEMFTGGGWVAGLAIGVLGIVMVIWIISSLFAQIGGRGRRE